MTTQPHYDDWDEYSETLAPPPNCPRCKFYEMDPEWGCPVCDQGER